MLRLLWRVTLLIKDARTGLYLCANGTWLDDHTKALRFESATAGAAYLQARDHRGAVPNVVWKSAEVHGTDLVLWPRT